ncbi:MAG: hypothetical protein FD145_379 [Candidatus Saganbacteria bacterium]|uniref:Ribosome silencing factor n=1 Tax=Candidatus Saganbacteria bacterium TaxID=2575572 RepID=A0A833NXE8_UNCSA|nr:MAG: hypothetical protein FD145_379 [Candidatus Saganbacteria bacterium]
MKKLLEDIVKAAEEKHAEDIIVLNIRKASRCVDFIIIMSAESRPQLKAVTGSVADK